MNWLNNTVIIKSNVTKKKPCYLCGYCPYGCLVEEFPLVNAGKINCTLFGHHCPMYYNAEDVTEEKKKEIIEKLNGGEEDGVENGGS